MVVTFYNFSKRINSTKQPTGAGTDVSVVLKEGCSVENPILVLAGNNFTYNYAYIGDFGRYYFVTDIDIQANGLVQVALSEDSLASAKTAIGNTVAHILYSSTGYDRQLADTRMLVKTTKKIFSDSLVLEKGTVPPTPVFDTTGCYILTVMNSIGSDNGFTCSYIMSYNDIVALAGFMMNMGDAKFQDLAKAFRSPFDAIVSCIWIPINQSLVENGCSDFDVIIGMVNMTTEFSMSQCKVLTVSESTENFLASITTIPHYDDFRAVQPYTSYTLYIPMYGVVDLNASDLRKMIVDDHGLALAITIDYLTGDVIVRIYQGTDTIIQSINYNIGIQCPLAQTSYDVRGAINAIGGVAGSVGNLAAGDLGGSWMNVAGSLLNFAAAYNTRSYSFKGSVNGRAATAWNMKFCLTEYAFDTEDPDDANYIARQGRPVGKTEAISSHSGYVQCDGASVDLQGFEGERDTINNYLNTGFYYE